MQTNGEMALGVLNRQIRVSEEKYRDDPEADGMLRTLKALREFVAPNGVIDSEQFASVMLWVCGLIAVDQKLLMTMLGVAKSMPGSGIAGVRIKDAMEMEENEVKH